MRSPSRLLPLLFGLVLAACASAPVADQASRQILSRFTGTFDSKVHSDGSMAFTLYTDGTLEGSWVTQNHTVTLNVTGRYTINGSMITVTAAGISSLRSSVSSRVIIFATGRVGKGEWSGTFRIHIDNPDFPDDSGTWRAVQAKGKSPNA